MNVSRRVIISLSLAFAIRVYLETLTPLKSMETLTLIFFFSFNIYTTVLSKQEKKKADMGLCPSFLISSKAALSCEMSSKTFCICYLSHPVTEEILS